MSLNKENVMDFIANMSVLELNDFAKEFKDKYDQCCSYSCWCKENQRY